MVKKIQLEEGAWFEVPLGDERRVVGMLARVSPQDRHIALGYFFDEIFLSEPALETLCHKRASEARVILRFSAFHLIRKNWAVIGKCENWNRTDWPMPIFVRQPLRTDIPYEVRFDDNDPLKEIAASRISGDVDRSLPKDGLYGTDAVPRYMKHLISQGD